MGKRIDIRSLIERRRQGALRGGPGEPGLPAAIADSLPLWNVVAARSGETLRPLLQTEVKTSVELAVTTHGELRATADKPGVLLPLDPPERGALVRFPGNSAQVLTDYLLRSADTQHPDDLLPEELDGLVVVAVIEAFAGLLYAAFGIPLRLPRTVQPKMIWALTPPPPEPRLIASFTMELAGTDRAEMQVLFRDTQEKAFRELMDRQERHLDLSEVTLPVSGILSRWYADAADLAGVEAGTQLVIPGGDLQRVAVEAQTFRGPDTVAMAELGTIRGRHALKISELSPGA